ncbi:MAG: hypothetical protein RJB61_942 [Actinomycetota bacterium]
MAQPPSHYFDDDPTVESSPHEVDLVLPDGRMSLTTDRGVFGYGMVDPGTKLLLMGVPTPPQAGHLLDLGCGYGPIAVTMARRAPGATVWAVDVNERARSLCAANAARHGLANIVVASPDDVPPEVEFAAIWSNPPIRIGKEALHRMLLRWLSRLSGEAWLVVHRHLGSDSLQAWLQREGFDVERVSSSRGYRVLRASGAPSGARRVDLDPA